MRGSRYVSGRRRLVGTRSHARPRPQRPQRPITPSLSPSHVETIEPTTDCRCATQASPLPGNATSTPQFVLLTHDDATAGLSTSLFQQAVGASKNPNGCTLPVTYFTMQGGSDCEIIKQRWQAGDEIAGHSLTHQQMDSKFVDTEKEIVGTRQWLINDCKIPEGDINGWRSPYLINNPIHRESIVKAGYTYDSTINEHYPDQSLFNSEPDTVSPNGGARVWPYTMDFGIAQNCAWTGNVCKPEERYKGLWEVPVWNIQTDNYPENAYALDVCATDIPAANEKKTPPCDIFGLLKENFDNAYAGNRAPVPLYFHSPWLSEASTMKSLQKFIDYATSKKDVYFVTMTQLIEWMKDPVGVEEMGAWLGCGIPGGKAAKGVAGAGAVAAAAAVPPVAVVPAVAAVPAVAVVPAVAAVPAVAPVAVAPVVPAADMASVVVPASGGVASGWVGGVVTGAGLLSGVLW